MVVRILDLVQLACREPVGGGKVLVRAAGLRGKRVVGTRGGGRVHSHDGIGDSRFDGRRVRECRQDLVQNQVWVCLAGKRQVRLVVLYICATRPTQTR